MASNTSKGRGRKGSKFWIQTIVSFADGRELSREIRSINNDVGKITWLSPLKPHDYAELKTKQIVGLETADFSFWPDKGPWWDAVGIDDKGCIFLVEAKAHVAETITKCKAKSDASKEKIKQSMREAHDSLNAYHPYDEDVWFNRYYQLGNRLTFLVKLREQGYNVKLVLLNIVADPTHIPTSLDEWEKHYNEVFGSMLGLGNPPENVLIVNVDVG